MSEGQRTFYSILKDDGEIKASHRLAKKYRKELDDYGVFDYQRRGKTEWLIVKNHEILEIQISNKFPNGLEFRQEGRLGGILSSRDSKKGGRASKVPVTMRFVSESSDRSMGFAAQELTKKNGIVSVLTDYSNNSLNGKIVIVENFDCFLHAERFVENSDVVIYAGGKIDSRLLEWIDNSKEITKIVHMGDYDPVGLAEFVRINTNCSQDCEFYIHADINIEIFKKYGKSSLVSDKRNSKTLEKLRESIIDDKGFMKIIDLITKTGLGLEQEYLLTYL
jgi:hypothetical protein